MEDIREAEKELLPAVIDYVANTGYPNTQDLELSELLSSQEVPNESDEINKLDTAEENFTSIREKEESPASIPSPVSAFRNEESLAAEASSSSFNYQFLSNVSPYEMPAEQASQSIDISFKREPVDFQTLPGEMSVSSGFNGLLMAIKADEHAASMEETRAKLFANFTHQSNQEASATSTKRRIAATIEERKERRKASNRRAAERSRNKKKNMEKNKEKSYHDVLVENVRLRDEVTRLKAIILSYEKCHRCLPGNMKLQWI